MPFRCPLLTVAHCHRCGAIVVALDVPLESGALERRRLDDEPAGGDSAFGFGGRGNDGEQNAEQRKKRGYLCHDMPLLMNGGW